MTDELYSASAVARMLGRSRKWVWTAVREQRVRPVVVRCAESVIYAFRAEDVNILRNLMSRANQKRKP